MGREKGLQCFLLPKLLKVSPQGGWKKSMGEYPDEMNKVGLEISEAIFAYENAIMKSPIKDKPLTIPEEYSKLKTMPFQEHPPFLTDCY